MAQEIPLSAAPRQTMRTILGSQNVRITAWYQPIDEQWYMTLSRLDRTDIITGVRLAEGIVPIRSLVSDFRGDLFVIGQGDIGPDGWTTTHRLIYIAAGEIEG